MTLSWFRIFLNAVSSKLAYQSFNPRLTWRKPTISGPEGIWNRRQRKAENQHWMSWFHLQASLTVSKPHQGNTEDTVHYSEHRDKSPLKLPSSLQSEAQPCQPESGFWEVQPWPKICWVMLESFPEVVAKEGWRGPIIRSSEMTTQPQPGLGS